MVTWRPRKNLGKRGKRALMAGDIAAPVAIINGPKRNITPKYVLL